MKNFTHYIFILLVISVNSYAQQEKGIVGEENWLNNWTDFRPNQNESLEPTKILTGSISENTTLYKKEVYLLLGSVFVSKNVTLTIEPGTVIIGDYSSIGSLTIAKGATIMAKGLPTDPIVFTSNRSVKKAGDWGGITILGDAPSNKFGNGSIASFHSNLNSESYSSVNYGGENNEDSSGVLSYVRVEFAGKRVASGNYFSGLLLAGVGNETVVENIMVSYAAGNAVEVLGGNLSMYNMVSYKANSNDYKFNYGAQCQILNSIAIRSPYVSSNEGSRCLQVLSYSKKDEVDFTKIGTRVDAKNLTFLNDSKDLGTDIKMNLVQEAVFIGKDAALNMNKSVISGFNPAVILDEKIAINQENLEKINFTAMLFNNCNGNIFVEYNSNNEDLENWYGNSAFFNVYSKGDNFETFIDTRSAKRPDYRLRINKIIASNEVDPDLRMD
ncbi:hypothetical protein [Algibacter pectinivorans]|uniref:Uncharacterized protein n=1 Tax=Algibacter pectinivorans TaxID=870482 RepID=A0A1I1RJX6_9FLAO|nr:hypothetical protein [Algibacter pectinivorans]SFD34616.1 hypothetical protein SAMN04487987_11054 [Algibacter pectinivorans]